MASFLEGRMIPKEKLEEVVSELDREKKEMGEMFGRFAQISSSSELSKVIDGTVKVLANSFQVSRGIIFTADFGERQLKPMRTVGYRLDSPDSICVKVLEPHWKFPDFDPYSPNQAARQRIIDIQKTISNVVRDLVLFVPVISDGRLTGGLVVQSPAAVEELQQRMYLLQALGMMVGNGFANNLNRGVLVRKIDEAQLETAKVQHQQISLKEAFSRYVSPSVVDEIARNPSSVGLGGKRQIVTILFADLRGFTALASKMPNEGLIVLLNDWLERASQRIFQFEGTIDKFLGDGIMALFGAPLPQSDHVLRAAYSAFQLQETFETYRRENRNILGENPLGMGIGIATGKVVVGNFGSSRRLEFTAVGDAVNMGARLEKVAEDGDIIIDKGTLDLLEDRFTFSTLSQVQLKGKDPMDVYRLSGIKKQWGS